MITIGIDGNEANTTQRVGIGQYAFQILQYLCDPKSSVEYKKNRIQFTIYLKDKPKSDLPPANTFWKYSSFGPKKFWTQIALPLHLFLDHIRPNVFFTPTHYAPRFTPSKCVISIMDVSYLLYPEMFRKKDLWQLRSWTEYSVRNSEKILTISNFSKSEILEYYNVEDEKVIVTYPGYDRNIFNPGNKAKKILESKFYNLKRKYNIHGEYILFVGTLQPRKNIVRLIEAFHFLQKKRNELQLVIIGKRGWLYTDLFEKIKELKLENKIVITDFVANDELSLFYQNAKCFVLPSLYEGFGLPVVEAMASGCPVVVSNTSSLPEIVGDAGILIDPLDTKSIVEGILQAGFSKDKRNDLIEKGLQRTSLFNWNTCVRKTFEVLYKVGIDSTGCTSHLRSRSIC